MPRLFKHLLTLLLILFYFSGLCSVWAQDVPVSNIPCDSSLRIRFKESWLEGTPSSVLSRRSIIETLPTGERVEIRSGMGVNEMYVTFSREQKRNNSGTGQYPGWVQGSWMLTRRIDTGAGTRIRIFLRSDGQTYIDLRPLNNERSQMDVVLYTAFLARSVPISIPFERLYTMQLSEIIRIAGEKFPHEYFNPDPALYRDSRAFVTEVRVRNRDLRYENNDGAINENGNYIFIETLSAQPNNPGHVNCSGYIKWLIDGCLRPVTGRRLPIEPLKFPHGQRGSVFTENYENFIWVPPVMAANGVDIISEGRFIEREVPLRNERGEILRRDPYFGLDWIRNLAAEANRILRSSSHAVLNEFEVRSDRFSLLMVRRNGTFEIQNYPGFLPDAGYLIEGLYPLLYTLAIENPFSFYLGAINNEQGQQVTAQNPRGGPRLRQFFHLAAFIPYFDEAGIFHVAVFESASESNIVNFINRNSRVPGNCINLVQVPVPSRFDP